MPSFFHLIVALGGTVLVAAVVALWLPAPQRLSPAPPGMPSASPKIVGNSALSHGGPVLNKSAADHPSTVRFQIGQAVIVSPPPQDESAIILPASMTTSPTVPSSSQEPRTVSVGTVVVITGMQVAEPVPGRTEQYYEVALPDGWKGWLSERVLRMAQ